MGCGCGKKQPGMTSGAIAASATSKFTVTCRDGTVHQNVEGYLEALRIKNSCRGSLQTTR